MDSKTQIPLHALNDNNACGNRLFCLLNFPQDDVPSIALDIGCAVGRSTFELAKKFNQVIGIDFSHGFINAANKLKTYGKLPYTVQTEGSLVSKHVAAVDPDIVSRIVYKALNYNNKKNSNNNKINVKKIIVVKWHC